MSRIIILTLLIIYSITSASNVHPIPSTDNHQVYSLNSDGEFYCEHYMFSVESIVDSYLCIDENDTGCVKVINGSVIISDEVLNDMKLAAYNYTAYIMLSTRSVCCSTSRLNFGVDIDIPVYIMQTLDMQLISAGSNITLDCIDVDSHYHMDDTQLTIMRIIVSVVTLAASIDIIMKVVTTWNISGNTSTYNKRKHKLTMRHQIYATSLIAIVYRGIVMIIDPYHSTGLVNSYILFGLIFNIIPISSLTTMGFIFYYDELTKSKAQSVLFINRNRKPLIITLFIYFAIHVLSSVLFLLMPQLFVLLVLIFTSIVLIDIVIIIVFYIVTIYRLSVEIKRKNTLVIPILMMIVSIFAWICLEIALGVIYIMRTSTPVICIIRITITVLPPLVMDLCACHIDDLSRMFKKVTSSTSTK